MVRETARSQQKMEKKPYILEQLVNQRSRRWLEVDGRMVVDWVWRGRKDKVTWVECRLPGFRIPSR